MLTKDIKVVDAVAEVYKGVSVVVEREWGCLSKMLRFCLLKILYWVGDSQDSGHDAPSRCCVTAPSGQGGPSQFDKCRWCR